MSGWRRAWGAWLLSLCSCVPLTRAAEPDDVLLKARVVDGSGQAVTRAHFLERASRAQLVCLGEQHDDPAHHALQLALWQRLAEQSEQDGRALALGLEMVQQPFQPAINDYLQGYLNAKELAEAVEWSRRWGFDFGFFRPLFHSAHELGADVLALNASRSLTRKVARGGLTSLTATERARLPQLDLEDEAHRRFFWEAMGFDAPGNVHGHGHGSGSAANPHHGGAAKQLRFYTAQVIWDESMASAASRWLHQHRNGRLLVLAGNGHCHKSAIVQRVQRRVKVQALSVLMAPRDHKLSKLAKRDYLIELAPAEAKGSETKGSETKGSETKPEHSETEHTDKRHGNEKHHDAHKHHNADKHHKRHDADKHHKHNGADKHHGADKHQNADKHNSLVPKHP